MCYKGHKEGLAMKFLLVAINAKYIHSNPAVYSLRAYAGEEYAPYIELAEYTINQQMDEILADIYKRKPTVVGFSCYIWNWRMVQELMAEVHALLPETHLWLGGPEVSYDAPGVLAEYPFLTGVMIGEGEATFRDLMEYYVGREVQASEITPLLQSVGSDETDRMSQIAGLCLPAGYTRVRPLMDMSCIPFLYDNLRDFEHRIVYYESSRGCPFRCSYCLSSVDKTVRLRDINIVKKELQFFLDKQVVQVKFIDRTFNCNHHHTMEIWKYILENDNGVTNFHFEVSADILREDEIELLQQMRPGLVQLEVGVQSVNDCALQAIHRHMDVDKLAEKVVQLQKNHNIHLHLDLIAGLPEEGMDSFRDSFNRVYGMHPEQLQLGFLKVLKGTEMWERAEEFDIRYHRNPPYEVLSTKWISYDDICRLKEVEQMVELYYNSGQFSHTVSFLERAFETPFDMYTSLAAYYRERGYFVNSPARVYRYQVLLQFAMEKDGANEAVYRELLTYDMYLRENLKSRPPFALDIIPYREDMVAFYKKEEEERNYLAGYVGYDWKQMSKMTHLEPFHYPVWDMTSEMPLWGKGTSYVLFDYQERNPLTGNAKIYILP